MAFEQDAGTGPSAEQLADSGRGGREVPRRRHRLSFGVLLNKTGAVWLSGVNFEVVGSNVLNSGRSRRDGPTNSGFETGTPGKGVFQVTAMAPRRGGDDSFPRENRDSRKQIKPGLLNHRFGVFGSSVPPQKLGKILGERRARQDHVASHFVRFLLQIALHVREEADD